MNGSGEADAPAVVLVGAFDTKAAPMAHLVGALRREGARVHRVDYGTAAHDAQVETDAEAVAAAAGTDLAAVRAGGRAAAMTTMGAGVDVVLRRLLAAGELDAVLFAGGSGAGSVFAASAATLPFGIAKVLVTTVAAGDTRPYLRGSDATLLHPVVDVEGDNPLLASVLDRAAATAVAQARVGRVAARAGGAAVTSLVGVTMFGITTPCVSAVRQRLEASGRTVVAFHANGTGGASLEHLVAGGAVGAVIDVTTTELADLVAGGTLSAGEARLTAAGHAGVAQVIVPGAIDTVNFGPRASVPERFADRILHAHNEHVTLMRTDVAESTRLGTLIGERASLAPATTTVVVPLGGFSELDRPEGPFWWPEADAAFVKGLREAVSPNVRVVESPLHVNDERFAAVLVEELDRLLAVGETA